MFDSMFLDEISPHLKQCENWKRIDAMGTLNFFDQAFVAHAF